MRKAARAALFCLVMAGVVPVRAASQQPATAQPAETQSGSSKPNQDSAPQSFDASDFRNSDQGQRPSAANVPVSAQRTKSEPVHGATQHGTNQEQSHPALGKRPDQSRPAAVPMARTAPVASEIHATLDKPVSAKTTANGEPLTATLTEPVRNNNGEVIVPMGAKLRGVVNMEESKQPPSVRGKGRIALRFTQLELPDGTTVPLQATLLDVQDTNGGTTNTGGYIAAQSGKDVDLPSATGLRLRLDQNLTVPVASGANGQQSSPDSTTLPPAQGLTTNPK